MRQARVNQEGMGQGTTFERNDIAWEHNINWLDSNGSKVADKSTLASSWFSVYASCILYTKVYTLVS